MSKENKATVYGLDTGLGCKRLTKSEEQELMSYINAKPTNI